MSATEALIIAMVCFVLGICAGMTIQDAYWTPKFQSEICKTRFSHKYTCDTVESEREGDIYLLTGCDKSNVVCKCLGTNTDCYIYSNEGKVKEK